MVVISCLGIIAELAGQSTLFAPDSYWFVYLIGSFFGLPFWAMREFVFSVNPAGPLPDIFRFLYFPMGLAFCIILDLVKVAIRRLRSNSGGSKI